MTAVLLSGSGGAGQDANSWAFTNVATNTTTAVKTGSGTLCRIVINKKVASGVITVYDNTAASGTKIATITNPGTLLDNAQVLDYNVAFNTGLTVVTSAADDITIVWK